KVGQVTFTIVGQVTLYFPKDYEYKRMYWHERYSTLLGEVQNKIYNLFLKGNNIPSGRKNYAEVIGILLSLEEK
ncbi:DUF3810 family protein, partial [Phocaeicola vulgatus]